MPLTKISTGLVSDSAITGVKINDASIQAVDLATASVTSDKLHTTLNLASHTVTLPENSISNRELNLTFTSGDANKFLKVSSTGALSWEAPGSYPIDYTAITGPIPANHIATGTITSDMIENLTISDGDIANGTISGGKLSTSLDLSASSSITFPTDVTVTNITVTGNLKTEGTTTEVDTQNLFVKDNIIRLNDDDAGPGVTAGVAGIEIYRGPAQDTAMIRWNETDDRFEFVLGSTPVNLQFANNAPGANTVGYNELKIQNSSDPGHSQNYFLESDGSGNFQLTQVDYSNFVLSGLITGTMSNTTFADDSIGTDKLQDYSITADKLERQLSFTGITTVLNAPDILDSINGAPAFTITNTLFTLPPNNITSTQILDGSVTVPKLANTLDLSSNTVILGNDYVSLSMMQNDSVGINEIIIDNTGSPGHYLTQNSAGNGFIWTPPPTTTEDVDWLGGLWPDGKENYSFVESLSGGIYTVELRNYQDAILSVLSPARIIFRDPDATKGKVHIIQLTSSFSLSIPAGQVFEYSNGEDMNLYIYAWLKDLSTPTVKLGVSAEYVKDEGENQQIYTFPSSGVNSLKGLIYSDEAKLSAPIRLMARIRMTQPTINSWTNTCTQMATNFQTFQLEYI